MKHCSVRLEAKTLWHARHIIIYHDCCRREYTRREQRHPPPKSPELLKSKETHSNAFEYIGKYIKETINTGQKDSV